MKIAEKVKGVFRRRPRQIELEEYLAKLKAKGLHPDGTAVLDPRPMAPPIGYIRQPSLVDQIREMVRSEHLARAAMAAGKETFEEADDFDIDDEYDMQSPWENEFDPPVVEIYEAGRQVLAEKAKAEKEPPAPPAKPKAKAKEAPPPSDGPDD